MYGNPNKADYHKTQATVVRKSDKAVLLKFDGNDDTHWVPYSCLGKLSDTAAENADYGDVITVHIMQWLWDKF